MEQHKDSFQTIDEYIATFPEEKQALLQEMRTIIKAAAPEAVELISYQMSAFAQHGNLVYFAALKNHIRLYPTASGIATIKDELSSYESSKGAVKFPINQPLPIELISKIIQFRVGESLKKFAAKRSKKKV